MFSPLLLKLLGFAVIAGGLFLSGYNVKGKFDTAAQAKAQAEAEAQYQQKDAAYNAIAAEYEKAKSDSHVQTQVVTKRVTQIVNRPIYRNVCLDTDGLSVVNAAINRTTPSAAGPDTTVPSAPAP